MAPIPRRWRESKPRSRAASDQRFRNSLPPQGWQRVLGGRLHQPGSDDRSGDVVQHFASFVDLTKHKEEQAQSRMLIDELNHRVKNTLSTVQSIVWQALRNASDPKVIRESIESRLFALSRSHDLLTRENWESAGLLDVVHEALEPFGVADGRAERLVITGREYPFPAKSGLGPWHCVPRTRDQRREIRGVFQRDGIDPVSTGRSSPARRGATG